jgi:hypothetical protein
MCTARVLLSHGTHYIVFFSDMTAKLVSLVSIDKKCHSCACFLEICFLLLLSFQIIGHFVFLRVFCYVLDIRLEGVQPLQI